MRLWILMAAGLAAMVAEPFAVRHARDAAGNPADLHFRLGIEGGKASFHRGERIPLLLEFWSEAKDTYRLNGATYDRSGRLPTEEFVLDREGAVDPFGDYLATGVLGGIGGGLRTFPVLSEKPERIGLTLNDWFRFDRTGVYRLYLKSHRLTRAGGKDGAESFAAVSNVLELTILDDDAGWMDTKVRALREVLAKPEPEMPKPGGPPVPVSPWEEPLRLARGDLRYLGTQEAVAMVLDDARKRGYAPDGMALAAARDRAKTVAAYDAYLADGTTVIRQWDLRQRALFTYLQATGAKPLPMYAWEMQGADDWKKLDAEIQRRNKEFDGFVRREALRLIPVALKKDKEARESSGETLAAVVPEEAKAAQLVPPDDYGLSREELVAQFPTLPAKQQAEILAGKWDLVRGTEMIPALRAVIERAPAGQVARNAMDWMVWGVEDPVWGAALRRLQELDAKEARRLVTGDLARGNARFGRFAALRVEAGDVPEADPVFARWLGERKFQALPVIAKFGTARLATLMLAAYEAKAWPCMEEAAFLSYFVRVLPGEGPGSAGELLDRALANREQRGCFRFLLGGLAGVGWTATVERRMVKALDDPDVEFAAEAARSLGAYGSAAAEGALWKRLERWAADGKAEERLGTALMEGLVAARAWLMDEARMARMRGLCLDNGCRERWEARKGAVVIDVSNGGGTYPAAFRVGGFTGRSLEELEAKLRQYPEGTTFQWCPQERNPFDSFTAGERAEMYARLREGLAGRGARWESCRMGI